MTISREELESLKALADAATEGPWPANSCLTLQRALRWYRRAGAERAEEDITFIAASREAVPRLIAELERARELLQAFVKAYEKATPVTEYDVVEANAYSEAAAYLIDAGVE